MHDKPKPQIDVDIETLLQTYFRLYQDNEGLWHIEKQSKPVDVAGFISKVKALAKV